IEVDAPTLGFVADAGGQPPVGDVGDFVAVAASGIEAAAAAAEACSGALELGAGPSGGEIHRQAERGAAGAGRIVLDDRLNPVDMRFSGVGGGGSRTETVTGVG